MTSARPDTWMPLYWGDYLRDTMHLRAEGHGVYMLLIAHYWTSGQPLPDDDDYLATVARVDSKAWKRLRPLIERFFQISDGVWRHKRIAAELEKAIRITEARREAGKRGGRPKANDTANDDQTESKSKAKSKQTETPSQPHNNNPPDASHPPPQGGKRARAERLPEGWVPTETMIAYATEKGFDADAINRIADDIRDWSRSSQKGAKLDWEATWRAWIRREADGRGDASRRRGGDQRQPVSVVAAANRSLAGGGRGQRGAGNPLADVWPTGSRDAAGSPFGGDGGDGTARIAGPAGEGDHGAALGDEIAGDGGGRPEPGERGDGAGVERVSIGREPERDPGDGATIDVHAEPVGDRRGVPSADGASGAAESPDRAPVVEIDLSLPDCLRRTGT